jgi:hypothetical protein
MKLRHFAILLALASSACGTLSPALPATFKCSHAQWEAGECYPQTEREYSGASDQEWYKSLMQPDAPVTSCCGAADAYYADEVDRDPDGTLVAIITDTRPDKRVVGQSGDGSMLYVNRPHLEPGTRIRVPASKLRKVPSFNPTDHTIIFVSNYGYVYCYEPAALM